MEGRSGVYTIWEGERAYVGSAIDLRRRLKNEMSRLSLGKHHNPLLQNALDKYGWKFFRIDIEFCEGYTEPELRKFELVVMNRLEKAGVGLFNIERDPSTALFAGRHHTDETKRKLSEAAKRQWESPEYQELMSEVHKGKTISEEHKRKISEANKGKVVSDETKRKLSEAKMGKTLSEETKRKISDTVKRLWQDEEYREKQRASQQARQRKEK